MKLKVNINPDLVAEATTGDAKALTRMGDSGTSRILPEGHRELVKSERIKSKQRLQRLRVDVDVETEEEKASTKKEEAKLNKLRMVDFKFGTDKKSGKPPKKEKDEDEEKPKDEDQDEESPDDSEEGAGDEAEDTEDEESEDEEAVDEEDAEE